MGLTLANFAGLWALLGIPVILLIHFLQKERREVVASTLFLLDNMQKESKSGIRLERLRNSLPLWLQILAVLLVTWILTEPRWVRADSFQRVVVVMDSSASMSAFREQGLASLDRQLARAARGSARTDWILLESDPRRGTLYSGDSMAAMRAALAEWTPRSGTHNTLPALEQARALLRGEGSVIFVTSRPHHDLPSGVRLLAVGSPFENCGFTGLRVEERDGELVWHALARNYGHSIQTREWRAVFGDQSTSPQSLRLDPGQTVSLSGRFPQNAEEGFLTMSGDRFTLDDWLPLVRPRPKPLAILVEEHPLIASFSTPFLRSLDNWHPPSEGQVDLRIATRLPHEAAPPHPGIYFLAEAEPPESILAAPIVAENHPFMRELNWQGLLVQTEAEVTLAENDRVLLWQGERPLIVLRQTGRNTSLFCHFDPRYSNAGRLPAFVVLLHRFVDEAREAKPHFEQRNLQTGQSYAAAPNPLDGDLSIRFRDRHGTVAEHTVEAVRGRTLLAPGEPGYLEVHQDAQPLFSAAVHFADSREADFSNASSEETGADAMAAQVKRNTSADFLTPVWLLLLAGALLFCWRIT